MSPDNPYVLKSYRYLRLVMVGLVVLLAASVLIELQQTGFGCWRTSISSYYWTPVRGVFVGALVAIGTCLIVLKGNTPVEDVLLNVAGALAPIVAFVPILDPKECQSTPWAASADGRANIFNNVGAFLLAGLVAVAVAWWVARREGRGRLSRADLIGLLVTIALVLAGIALFLWAREFFDRWAHYLAAIPLFLVLVAVMVVNAVSYARTKAAQKGREMGRAELANRYLAIAALTVALVVTLGLVTWLGHWRHGTFWLEVVVIAAFAVFWAVQTAELWGEDEGLRPDPEGVLAPQSKAGEVGTQ
jgi:putative Mn2+ efflux pump MntP